MTPPAPPAAADPVPSRPATPSGVSRAGHLAFVAHEVRNPLSTALWSAELLERLPPADRAGERGARLAGLCLKALARVQLLVEDHLLCERLDAGGHPLRAEPLALAPLLEGVLERLALDPRPAVEVPPGLSVRADRALAERALAGLLAVAARGGQPARVAARAEDGEVRILVAGEASAPLEDPDRGTATDPASRSLALPLARRVAEVCGGRLSLEAGGYLLVFPGT